jgi:hypothetical protein
MPRDPAGSKVEKSKSQKGHQGAWKEKKGLFIRQREF